MNYLTKLDKTLTKLAVVGFIFLAASVLLSPASAQTDQTLFAIEKNTIPPPFSAEYSISMGSMQLGQLIIELLNDETNAWTYRATTQAQGLAAMFVGGKKMIETSHLEVIGDSIRPVLLERIQITNNDNKSERAVYEWHNNLVKTSYKDRRLQHTLNKYSLDKFTLQLALMSNLKTLPKRSKVAVISKAKIKNYVILRHGEKTIQTPYGKRHAILIERQRGDGSYIIWADKKKYGLPLKIQHTKNGKIQYEVMLTSTSLL